MEDKEQKQIGILDIYWKGRTESGSLKREGWHGLNSLKGEKMVVELTKLLCGIMDAIKIERTNKEDINAAYREGLKINRSEELERKRSPGLTVGSKF